MLIFDIETKTFNGEVNPQNDELRYIGFYEYEKNKYSFYSYKERDKIKSIFKEHKVIIGFNSHFYDEPILKRAGIWNPNHTHLDLYKIIKKRESLLGCQNESKSLKNLARFFKLADNKGDLDYNLLKKDINTKEEIELIKKYTLQDIKVTKELFDYVSDYFKPFKEYLNSYQNRRFYWMTSSIAAYTYKAICNLTGINEEYDDNTHRGDYKGGFVSTPEVDEAHGNILLFDFTSLYPFTIIQNNLINKKIEDILLTLYKRRLKYKRVGDTREYVIKIILNSFYGILANPVFKSVYNLEGAKECTRLGRESIKLARRVFREFGYKVLYSDTDSIYIQLNSTQTKQQAKNIANLIIKKIQKTQTRPDENFKLKIDDEIKHIYFFKTGGQRLKKLYIYVTNENKVIIKGLPIIKRDSSKIGLKIFKKYIEPKIKNGERYVTIKELKEWVGDLLKDNIKVSLRAFYVADKYKYKLKSQLQYKISERYGAGRHKLIGNDVFGVGCSVKYCTLKEFKENGLNVDNIDLGKFWKEMSFFLKEPYKLNRKKEREKNNNLAKWI